MTDSRVTIQDIADALGLSRNTVSKAINNTGSLAEATREKILNKAIEMGYKQFSYLSLSDSGLAFPKKEETAGSGEIALFTTKFLGNSHFSSTMLDKFQQEITRFGYRLTMHLILEDDIRTQALPNSFNAEKTSGIICFEMFDANYSKLLCTLDIPTLFVDAPSAPLCGTLKADTLFMENRSNIISFVREMHRRGKERIGYAGDQLHCHSFYERYSAYREGMDFCGLSFEPQDCILGSPDNSAAYHFDEYRTYLSDSLEHMKTLPEVFICANDFVAIDLLQIFKEKGISVPGDIFLCGFDDSPESRVITPTLTTIHIHSQIMGISAADLLLSRIKEPSLNFRTLHTETNLLYRESTGD